MRVVRAHSYGGPEVLQVDDLPLPPPGPGQVLAKVEAAGVNFFDTQLRSGLYKLGPLPVALGNEGAGTVEAVGAGVESINVNDRVAWILAAGSYATHVVVPAQFVAPLPKQVSFADAAATIFQGITAHYLARSAYALRAGDTCLVHSAAGGVGILLCQMAKYLGARVIGAVSSAAKSETARDAGVDDVIVYADRAFDVAVRDLTGGAGVRVVYDAVGAETFERSLNSLMPRGHLVVYGEASGLIPPFDVRQLLFRGSLSVTRTGLNHFVATREEFLERAEAVFNWLCAGTIRQRIDQIFSLDQAAEAHRALEQRETTGKLLLMPSISDKSTKTP